jgi:flotillin
VAKLEAEGAVGEAEAERERQVATAEQQAITAEGQKQAERNQRIRVAVLEAEAVQGENESQANIAASNATLDERRADASRRGEVATAEAARDVFVAEKDRELARLQKEQIVQQEIERQRIEIEAEAEAEKRRRIARGEADAVLAKYNAEAEGIQRVLEAKAQGYENLLRICAERPDLAPTLLVIEKLPELVAEQVKAIQNLKIDKITVWDSGSNSGSEHGATAGFMRGLISSLPPLHELAAQAGIDLPEILGQVSKKPEAPSSKAQGDVANGGGGNPQDSPRV